MQRTHSFDKRVWNSGSHTDWSCCWLALPHAARQSVASLSTEVSRLVAAQMQRQCHALMQPLMRFEGKAASRPAEAALPDSQTAAPFSLASRCPTPDPPHAHRTPSADEVRHSGSDLTRRPVTSLHRGQERELQ